MTLTLNPHLVHDTATPPVPEARGWLAAYAGGAGPAVDLAQAVPSYPPHPLMLQRLAAAAGDAAYAGYGAILGDEPLRAAYAAHVSELYRAPVATREVAITAGCNQAFALAVLTLAKAGDAVMLPSPWYFNHQMTLAFLGIEPVALACRPERGFVPDPEDAAALLDRRATAGAPVKAIVLVTPNNPTGAVYDPATIAAFAGLCRDRGIALVIDETYRDFLPAGAGPPHGLFADPAWRDSVIQLYSFSKSYCIPGHRLGAMAAGAAILAETIKVMDCLQICPARPGQVALAPAIADLAPWRETNRAEIERRAAAFRAVFDGLNGWRLDSIGAYFAFLKHPFEGVPAADVARRLAASRGVLTLPGPWFGPGQESHLRVAFANAGTAELAGLGDRLAGFDPG
jgi:aspartate/methionine/tyrosine aminotransferase